VKRWVWTYHSEEVVVKANKEIGPKRQWWQDGDDNRQATKCVDRDNSGSGSMVLEERRNNLRFNFGWTNKVITYHLKKLHRAWHYSIRNIRDNLIPCLFMPSGFFFQSIIRSPKVKDNKVNSKMCEGHNNNKPWIVYESKLGINNLAWEWNLTFVLLNSSACKASAF